MENTLTLPINGISLPLATLEKYSHLKFYLILLTYFIGQFFFIQLVIQIIYLYIDSQHVLILIRKVNRIFRNGMISNDNILFVYFI